MFVCPVTGDFNQIYLSTDYNLPYEERVKKDINWQFYNQYGESFKVYYEDTLRYTNNLKASMIIPTKDNDIKMLEYLRQFENHHRYRNTYVNSNRRKFGLPELTKKG